jgi:predicted MFS family arabinose efflux permease
VLLAGLAVVEWHSTDPLLPLTFLLNGRRLSGLFAINVAAGATVAACLFLTLHMQQRLGWTALRTSGAFVPYAVALIVTGPAAGYVLRRVAARTVAAAGVVLVAAGLFVLSGLDEFTTYLWRTLPGLLLLPVGAALTFSAAAVLVIADTPPAQTGLAGGVLNTAIELGPTAGLAIAAAVASARTAHLSATGVGTAEAVTGGYSWGLGATGLTALLVLASVLTVPARRESGTTQLSIRKETRV